MHEKCKVTDFVKDEESVIEEGTVAPSPMITEPATPQPSLTDKQEAQALKQASRVLEENDDRFYKFVMTEKPNDAKAATFTKVMQLPNCSLPHFRHRGGHIFHVKGNYPCVDRRKCKTDWDGYHLVQTTTSPTPLYWDVEFAKCDPRTIIDCSLNGSMCFK